MKSIELFAGAGGLENRDTYHFARSIDDQAQSSLDREQVPLNAGKKNMRQLGNAKTSAGGVHRRAEDG